jgi:flagellar basal-body rod protein FlgB
MYFEGRTFKTLEAGMQAAWLQQQVHTQNLANIETPNYKAKSVVFDQVLRRTMRRDGEGGSVLRARVVEDNSTEVRTDGNNVDADAESLELYKAYVHYSMLTDKIRSEIDNYNYVLNNGPR